MYRVASSPVVDEKHSWIPGIDAKDLGLYKNYIGLSNVDNSQHCDQQQQWQHAIIKQIFSGTHKETLIYKDEKNSLEKEVKDRYKN